MESLGKYLTFRNRPGNRPEEGSLLLKRTKKGTGEVPNLKKQTEEGSGEGS